MAAGAARDEINQANPGWNVAMVWTADTTQFTSATANGPALRRAVENELPHYLYSLSDVIKEKNVV
jgi:hypothetical protein